MPSEWRVVQATAASLQRELNTLDTEGYEIYEILLAAAAVGATHYNIVARKNR